MKNNGNMAKKPEGLVFVIVYFEQRVCEVKGWKRGLDKDNAVQKRERGVRVYVSGSSTVSSLDQ